MSLGFMIAAICGLFSVVFFVLSWISKQESSPECMAICLVFGVAFAVLSTLLVLKEMRFPEDTGQVIARELGQHDPDAQIIGIYDISREHRLHGQFEDIIFRLAQEHYLSGYLTIWQADDGQVMADVFEVTGENDVSARSVFRQVLLEPGQLFALEAEAKAESED